jgi:nucleotide-binding universal stress UspA family protein
MMMKQIIVPLDFSEESMNALEMALLISSRNKADIQMVNVLDTSHFEEEQRVSRAKLNDIVLKYENRLGSGVKLSYIVKRGKVCVKIVDQAESFDNSVIILSSHGSSGFDEFFHGSNAFRIINSSERPVIAIRHGIQARRIHKILLPIDYSPETRQKVPYVTELARGLEAQVHVLAVSSGKDEELLQRLRSWLVQTAEYLEENKIDNVTAKRNGESIPDLIIDYVKAEKIDLISIMTEKNSSISNLVFGNNALELLNKSPVPILCFMPKELHNSSGFRSSG